MRQHEINKVVEYLKEFKKIDSINRVSSNIVKIKFDNIESIFFDLSRDKCHIYITDEKLYSKEFKSPFDVTLKKSISNSLIDNIEIINNDKIIRFLLKKKNAYKEENYYLQLELINKKSNLIITNSDMIIISALKYSTDINSRKVTIGTKLSQIEKFDYIEPTLVNEIVNIKQYLIDIYIDRSNKELKNLKKVKITTIDKKIDKLQKIYNNILPSDEYLSRAYDYKNRASILLANINNIPNYTKKVTLKDFNGKDIVIELSKPTIQTDINDYFNRFKKAKAKAKGSHIEIENINSKISYLISLKDIISRSDSSSEINILMPKNSNKKIKQKKSVNYEDFFYKNFKIMVGKNKKGNIELLKKAKGVDIWMHLKNINSSHVIIVTDKQNISSDVLNFAAKLCACFSSKHRDTYSIDYTKRKFVKVKDGANVLYTEFKTIKVTT